ncbi:MAG: hypothetical protein R2839_00130 [Thermomicrobiales bacterium]
MLDGALIAPHDIDLLVVTDDIEYIIESLVTCYRQNCAAVETPSLIKS